MLLMFFDTKLEQPKLKNVLEQLFLVSENLGLVIF